MRAAIVPQRLSTVLRFQNVNNALSMSLSPSAYQVIALNGCYDPLYTLGGGSCTGFAELSQLYNRYIVSRVAIRMNIRNSSANSIGNDIVGYVLQFPSSQLAAVGTVITEDVLESRRCVTEMIPYNNANQYKELCARIDICEIEGLPSLIAAYDALSGNPSSNPARTPVAFCGVTRPTGSQAGCSAEMTLVVEFSVTFYQPTTFMVS